MAGISPFELDSSYGRLHVPDLFRMLRRLGQGIANDRLLCVLLPLHLLVAALIVRSSLRRADELPEESELDRCGSAVLA